MNADRRRGISNRPTKVQVAQVSDASAENAPFIYFDAVLTAGVHQGNVRLELGEQRHSDAKSSGENDSRHNGTLTM
jgi:hypothetical protein